MATNSIDHASTESRMLGISERAWILLIVLAAMAIRMWGLDFGLPQRFHTDEPVVVTRAQYGAATDYWNPEAFHWPSLQIYILGFEYKAWYWIGNSTGAWNTDEYGEIEPEERFIAYALRAPGGFYYLGRLTTALFGAGIILLLYILARRMFDYRIALGCAFLASVNPILARHSRYITPDIPSEFFLLAVLLYLDFLVNPSPASKDSSRLKFTHSRWWYVLMAAILLGLGTGTKYPVGFMGFPMIAVILAYGPGSSFIKRIPVAFIAGLISIAVFFLTTPYAIIEWEKFTSALREIGGHVQSGQHIGMEISGSIWSTVLGSLIANMGVILTVMGIVGLVTFFFVKFRRSWHIAFSLIVVLSGIAPLNVFSDRYLVPLIPLLLLGFGHLAGYSVGSEDKPRKILNSLVITIAVIIGLMEGLKYLLPVWLYLPIALGTGLAYFKLSSSRTPGTNYKSVAVAILLIAVGSWGIYKTGTEAHALTLTDTRELALEWVEDNIPGHSVIVEEQGGPDLYTDDLVPLVPEPWYFVTTIEPLFTLECLQTTPLEKMMIPNPDWVITSSYVRGRYEREEAAAQFPELVESFNEYYSFIDNRLTEVARFSPGNEVTGEEVVVYRTIHDTRDDSLEWIEGNIPTGSLIVMEEGGPDIYFIEPENPDADRIAESLPEPWYYVEEIFLSTHVHDSIQNPLETLVVTGPDWVITNSIVRDKQTSECAMSEFPDLAQVFANYYSLIDGYLQEEARFTPDEDMMGPEVVIYKVPEGFWQNVQLGSGGN